MWTVPWYQDMQQVYQDLQRMKGEIMSELETRLEGVRDKLVEATGEILDVVSTLRQQVADGQVDPATVTQLETLAQGLADIVPGSPVDGGTPSGGGGSVDGGTP